MAEARYSTYATYGSAAYDLSRSQYVYAEAPVVDIPVYEPEARPERGVKTAPKSRRNPLLGTVVSVGLVMLVGLIVLNLLSFAMLVQVSEATGDTEDMIVQLQEDKAKLLVKYEKAFNLSEIEAYAVNVLGMVRATADQKIEVSTVKSDRAVVYDYEAEKGSSFLADLSNLVGSLLEYF